VWAVLVDKVEFSLSPAGPLPVEQARLFPWLEQAAEVLAYKLFRQSSLVGPYDLIQVPEFQSGQSQLSGADSYVNHHHFEEAGISFGSERGAVGGCVFNAVADPCARQHFDGLLKVPLRGIRVHVIVNKIASLLFWNGIHDAAQQIAGNVLSVFIKVIPVGGN
jgi:hypothetical protein